MMTMRQAIQNIYGRRGWRCWSRVTAEHGVEYVSPAHFARAIRMEGVPGTVDEEASGGHGGRGTESRRKGWVLGILLILVVVAIWVASSFVVQGVLKDFRAPFFLTFFSFPF